ncbi:unnamed protein product [Sphenostylis stenocarpa]|uniref:Uncharacterized protein n=1 Tax=Sphenostylis stenocarpa TaxID=92480 RepID=A0AA86S5J7_9FABA|nr:unnamed protein product [Sphenostylis stenocarpa]
MPRIKNLAQCPPMKSNKEKRQKTSSPLPERATSPSPERPNRNLSTDLKRQLRYEEIKHWVFITERKVELYPGEFDPLLIGLIRRHWNWILANLLPKFDLEIVRQFYANAYPSNDPGDKRSKVKGVRKRGCD